jgi:hypothetical protein
VSRYLKWCCVGIAARLMIGLCIIGAGAILLPWVNWHYPFFGHAYSPARPRAWVGHGPPLWAGAEFGFELWHGWVTTLIFAALFGLHALPARGWRGIGKNVSFLGLFGAGIGILLINHHLAIAIDYLDPNNAQRDRIGWALDKDLWWARHGMSWLKVCIHPTAGIGPRLTQILALILLGIGAFQLVTEISKKVVNFLLMPSMVCVPQMAGRSITIRGTKKSIPPEK